MANNHRSFSKGKRWRGFSTSTLILSLIFLLVLAATTFIIHWIDLSKTASTSLLKTITIFNRQEPKPPLICTNDTSTCPANYHYSESSFGPSSPSASCPEYFRWIHEDLKPWERTGITRDMVERGQNNSHFRLVVLDGKAYVKKYKKSFQTRDVFTIWGILQLLRLYPGKVPDLDMMFQCGDKTVVGKSMYNEGGGVQDMVLLPPPVFHYCGDENSYDIVFPDWTFWGWAELNIRPWESTLEALKEGNKKVKWETRVPYAFWKGNPAVAPIRKQLEKCNVTDQQDWNARLYSIQWLNEKAKSFQDTKLEDQCDYRYKIYVEGATWSVSEKYIIACDSMTMFIEPRYFDFFSRSMVPLKHFWPISAENMCDAIKFAVDWGNTHQDKAQEIGKGGTNYIIENLRMKYVYDYMFHLLNNYAKLLRYKPTIPDGAIEICSESMACPVKGLRKRFLVESMVKSPSDTLPCSMPPPYEPSALQELLLERDNLVQQVKKKAVNE